MPTPPDRTFRSLTLHSLSCGLAAVVPIPFVDDLLHRQFRRSWVRDLARDYELQLDELGVDHVAGIHRRSGWRRVLRLAYTLTVRLLFKLVRRVFRSIFFFLALKDAADAASDAFHRAYLEWRCLERLAVQRGTHPERDHHRLLATGWAIDHACREIDTRAVQRTLATALESSRAFLRSLSHRWSWTRSRASASEVASQAASGTASEVVDEVARELQEMGYLDALDRRCAQLAEYWSQPEFHRPRRPPAPQGAS